MRIANSYTLESGDSLMVKKIETLSGIEVFEDGTDPIFYFDIGMDSGRDYRVVANSRAEAEDERGRVAQLLNGIGWQ